MIAGRGPGPVLALALCVAGLAASWFAYQGLQAPAGARRGESVAGAQPGAINLPPAGQDFQLPPLGAFEATLERPIFSPSRRPKAGAAVVVSQDLALKMQGAISTDHEMRALLVPEGGGEPLNLREGEEYLGWTLSEIGLRHVIFRRDDQTVRLEADFKESPPPIRTRPGQLRPGQPQGAQGIEGQARQNQLQQQRLQQQQQRLQQQQQRLQQQQQRLRQQQQLQQDDLQQQDQQTQ